MLKHAELGMPAVEVIRKVAIAYKRSADRKGSIWLEGDQLREFKQLQDEDLLLKRLVADLLWQGDSAGCLCKKKLGLR